mmetsp:Transcript_70175/g.180885  ORF Transcript_70175/g.180885 Transcript_70175/m.180885 type:complete len:286 (+) Transcript_70175:358-1215(+)
MVPGSRAVCGASNLARAPGGVERYKLRSEAPQRSSLGGAWEPCSMTTPICISTWPRKLCGLLLTCLRSWLSVGEPSCSSAALPPALLPALPPWKSRSYHGAYLSSQRLLVAQPLPAVVSLSHAAANASFSARTSFANSITIGLKPSSFIRATSAVRRITWAYFSSQPAALHWWWPPGPMCLSHMQFTSTWKYSLLHFVGVVVHGPSKPLVTVSLPTPLPHRPAPAGHAPWALPNAWPPPIRATVSLSSMPMRENASRTSGALSEGSGLGAYEPSGISTTGPSGFT